METQKIVLSYALTSFNVILETSVSSSSWKCLKYFKVVSGMAFENTREVYQITQHGNTQDGAFQPINLIKRDTRKVSELI